MRQYYEFQDVSTLESKINLEEVGLATSFSIRYVIAKLRVDRVVSNSSSLRAERFERPSDANKVIIVPVDLSACSHPFVWVMFQHLLAIYMKRNSAEKTKSENERMSHSFSKNISTHRPSGCLPQLLYNEPT